MSPRARPMPADQRRASIIAAARSLLISSGITFTTRQVAEAAGIAEGTIFRHFASKDDIVQAVIEDIFDPSGLCSGIDALPRDLDLTQRVERSLELMTSQLGTITEVMAALHPHRLRGRDDHSQDDAGAAGGPDPRRHEAPGARDLHGTPRTPQNGHGTEPTDDRSPRDHQPGDHPHHGIRNWYSSVTTALNRLLEPYADQLRVPPEQACALMLSTVTMSLRPIAVTTHKFSPADLTDILLNGIAAGDRTVPPSRTDSPAGDTGSPPAGPVTAPPTTPAQESSCS